jgi:dTDP-4-amino-4,6-dideoxygalactose transaminase
MSEPVLPYSRHTISEEDISSVVSVLRGDWLTSGPSVERFESALAVATGARHAVACTSGTAALHLAMLALGIGPGDAVIVPTMTFLSTANAVRFAGGEVVFADVDADTGLLTADLLAEALSRVPAGLRPKAVIPVHLNGLPCDMRAIAEIASRHGLAVVEDAAHALGARYEAKDASTPVGSFPASRMACFSFHPVKTIAMGEGGAVTTDDAELATRVRTFRTHGVINDPQQWMNPDLGVGPAGANPWYYEMQTLGYNYRVSDIQCALGTSQLRKLPDFVARRQALAARYDAQVAQLSPQVKPHVSGRMHRPRGTSIRP